MIDKSKWRIPFDNFRTPFDRDSVEAKFVIDQGAFLHSDRRPSHDLKMKPWWSDNIKVRSVTKKGENPLGRIRQPQTWLEVTYLHLFLRKIWGMAGLFPEEIQDGWKKQTEQNAGSQWKVNLNIVPLHIEIARKLPKPGNLDPEYGNQANNSQQNSQNDQNLSQFNTHIASR
jgi:hypothetical protein